MTTPESFGLSKRTIIRHIGTNHIAIEKKIKSRIISKDARKIVEMAQKIQNANSTLKVSLICTKNICSKSIALLQEHQINIIIEELE